jgi:uncharacterized protein (DUF362 family)/NAD-dependent dihydropyrimidine dehydrogenase PreA subunit
MSSKVSIVKCDSYEPAQVERAIRDSLALLGEMSGFIKPNSKVLVKPNLLLSKGPECAITTHPVVVRAVIRILKEINCKIIVGDGPSVWGHYVQNVDEVYAATGIKAVCQEEGVQLVRFDKRRMRQKFPLTTYLDECDALVNLPKFKTHELTLITGAVKNLFGLVSGTYKTELHKNYFAPEEFAKILVDIYQEARPSLTIIDGILAMEGDGPATGGTPRPLGLLLAGDDCVALDTVVARIMGVNPQDVLTTKEAGRRNLGESDFSKIKIEGEDLNQLKIRPFILPKNAVRLTSLPPLVQKMFKSLVRYYPYSLRLKCTRCGHCVKVCPKQCITLSAANRGGPAMKYGGKRGIDIDYKKCIACFCCQESCPEAAIGVKKSLLAKLIGL